MLGASGAGKSTLLAALAGLLDPSHAGDAQGLLTVDGRDPATSVTGPGWFCRIQRRNWSWPGPATTSRSGWRTGRLRCRIWPVVDASLAAVGFLRA